MDPVCPQCEELWLSMPQCEELWTQYVPVLGTVDPVFLGEAIVTSLPEPVGSAGMSAG